MLAVHDESEAWKKMVLRSMPKPAWLGADAPQGDVVVSTRVRFARNLRLFNFPSNCTGEDFRKIESLILNAVKASGIDVVIYKNLTEAEHHFLLGCRLVSPEFRHRAQGRAVVVDRDSCLSLMVNEEDHIRLQALTAGWSHGNCLHQAMSLLQRLEKSLSFAQSDSRGYLTASPWNAGEGKRISALFHLIGLAHLKRLGPVMHALAARSLTARGLFGESSRAVGAFFQVSASQGLDLDFIGACEYLLAEEREARRQVPLTELESRIDQAVSFVITSRSVALADALRILAWLRWGCTAGLPLPFKYRDVDSWVSIMEVGGSQDNACAKRQRADFLRARLSG